MAGDDRDPGRTDRADGEPAEAGADGERPSAADRERSATDGASSPTVVAVGAATVDRTYAVTNLPVPDGGAFARSVSSAPGGVGANVAAGCARLERSAGLVARLGDGRIGEEVAADLAAGPIDDRRVRREPGTTTHCLVLREDGGERMIVTAGDSTTPLRLDDADLAYLRAADAVFVTAYAPDPVVATLAEAAADPSFPPLAFDLSGPLAELAERGADPATIDRVAERAALFVAGDVAADSYLDVDPEAARAALRERGVERAALTHGADGATLVTPTDTVAVPAFDVDAVDATGAGDAYTAGLIDRWLLGGDDPERAGRWAAAVAALNCRAEGARGGLPTADEVRAFLG